MSRREDDALLRGSATFVADLAPRDCLHVTFVRSTVPAGRIRSVDTARAQTLPGVHAVITGAEVARFTHPIPRLGTLDPGFAEDLSVRTAHPTVPVMAADQVRYAGEPLAVVVAGDRYIAEDAAELVLVDIDPEDALVDAAAALHADRAVNPDMDTNVGVDLGFAFGEGMPDPAPGQVVVERELTIARQTALPMEPRGVLAIPEASGVTVWNSTQVPHQVRRAIAGSLNWDESRVRCRTPHVGGGFGQKATVYGEEVVLALLADRLQRPVTWIEDRYENLIASAQARDQVHRARLVVDADGRIVHFEDDYLVNLGAHDHWMVGVVANAALHIQGPYLVPSCRVSGVGVFTNKAPTAQYRGAGRPEATFALERCLDMAAHRLGIGPAKIREVNVLRADDLPRPLGLRYRDGVPMAYDGQDYSRVLAAAQSLVPEEELVALRAEAAPGTRIGLGLGAYVEATARGRGDAETAVAELAPDGTMRIATGAASSGQSHSTVFATLAAATARRPADAVEVTGGDTGPVPQGLGTFASRIGVVAGSAVKLAVQRLVEDARDHLSTIHGAAVSVRHVDNGFDVDGSHVSWSVLANGWPDRTPVTETFAPTTVTWTMGCHVAVVAVDVRTGQVSVLRYGVAHEGGPALDARVVDGQLRGGAVQGIGGALLETVGYDDSGQPTSATLADYLIPTTMEVPEVRLHHIHVESTTNPLRTRGVGESGIIGSGAAIAAAVEDALGVGGQGERSLCRTPILPVDVLDLLHEAVA